MQQRMATAVRECLLVRPYLPVDEEQSLTLDVNSVVERFSDLEPDARDWIAATATQTVWKSAEYLRSDVADLSDVPAAVQATVGPLQ